MLSPAEIQGMAERKYPSYLRSLVTGDSIFPLRIRFGVPSTTDEFAKLQKEVTALATDNFGYTIEWQEKNTRKWGLQRLPAQVRFDSEEQFVAALGKHAEAGAFRNNVKLTTTRLPGLKLWVASHVKWLVESAADWDRMILVCEYFLANPRPNLYSRELPIQVHTKFIENNTQVLSSMLSELLPDAAKSEGDTFEQKFGLKTCEPLIRFRTLDPALRETFGISHDEMALSVSSFAGLRVAGVRVIITENLMNFLCLPAVPNGLAVFGHGNAAELLTGIAWLRNNEIFYWGDIDEHGFHILSRLRAKFPHTMSILMDSTTLLRFRDIAGKGEPAGKPPANLTREELDAYTEVARYRLRLEQEKISQIYSATALNGRINEITAITKGVDPGKGKGTPTWGH
jgi:hypothetical protein